jgi:hypothetical protein
MYNVGYRRIVLNLLEKICDIVKVREILIAMSGKCPSRTTIWRWKARIEIKKRQFGSIHRSSIAKIVIKLLQTNPTLTQVELRNILFRETKQAVCLKTIRRILREDKITRKRVKLRGLTKPAHKNLIEEFKRKYSRNKGVKVSIDECGFNEKLRPIYGYSHIGEDVIMKVAGSWKHTSLLLAVFDDGRSPVAFCKKGAILKTDFENFLSNLKLTCDDMILLDNASIHKKLITTCKATLCYTPPYSPQFNPIEIVFHSIKSKVRKDWQSDSAMFDKILKSVNETDIKGITNAFKHVDNLIRKID